MASDVVYDAPVQWWNATAMAVLCPYCHETHQHGFVEYEDIYRVSHCRLRVHQSLSYKLVYPFDSQRNEARYEINKVEGRFESTEFPPKQRSDAEIAAQPRPQRPKFSDGSIRTIPMRNYRGELVPLEMCDVQLALSACVTGNVAGVQEYLNKFRGTNDYEVFLHGEDGNGNTALCCAAMESEPEMVKLLLLHGSDMNAQNNEGRTPLMEAALWARHENAELLLEEHADKTLRDHDGKLAIDLAQPSEENQAERLRRVPDYQEDAYRAMQDREHIALMLGEPNEQERGKSAASSIDDVGDTVDGWTSAALLDRGDGFPEVHALSRTIGGVHETLVCGQSLARLVAKIAAVVGHNQAPASHCAAGHVEKQLIALFVDNHVFWEDGTLDDEELNSYLAWKNQYGPDEELNEEELRYYTVAEMKRVPPPPTRHRLARIVSNAGACADCEEFRGLVNKTFGLELVLQYAGDDAFGADNEWDLCS